MPFKSYGDTESLRYEVAPITAAPWHPFPLRIARARIGSAGSYCLLGPDEGEGVSRQSGAVGDSVIALDGLAEKTMAWIQGQ